MIGKKILNYEIKSLIGEGGMGNVYLGEHLSIGRKVAIKVLRPELASNQEIRSRFKNEASVMAHLQHPGIVSLFDYVEEDDGLYLIMELVEGEEITDLLKKLNEPLSIKRAKDIMLKVLNAFAYAHKSGIVHRDVKPSNILITGNEEIKVLDFGIAKLVGDSQFNLTKTGTQVGTVYYMSPEQVKAQELDQRSDIYSLGVTFYELLAGFCPYKSMTSEYEVYDKIVREPLLPLTDTMGEDYAQVWSVIQKATAKEPNDRFQDCNEFIEAIQKGASIQSKSSSSAKATEPIKKTTSKNANWVYWVSGGVTVLIIVVLAIPLLQSESKDESKDDYETLYAEEPIPEEIEEEVIEEPIELENWMGAYQVNSIIQSYYSDKNNDEFNAYNYYAPSVNQFISRKNVTPEDINRLASENTEYLNGMAWVVEDSYEFSRVEGEISYWIYWVDYQCFRRSKSKIQKCQIKIEIGFNQNSEIKSYRELEVSGLEYVESYDE